MSRIDIIVDIETLGKTADTPIFEIGAVAYNSETSKELYYHKSFCLKGTGEMIVSASTLLWWLKTDAALLSKVLHGENSYVQGIFYTEHELLEDFFDWICSFLYDYGENNVFLWGNGILFDNKLLQERMNKFDITYPVYYRNDRDLRTLFEIAAVKTGCADDKEFRDKYVTAKTTAHSALDDAKNEFEAFKAADEIIYGGCDE